MWLEIVFVTLFFVLPLIGICATYPLRKHVIAQHVYSKDSNNVKNSISKKQPIVHMKLKIVLFPRDGPRLSNWVSDYGSG